MEIVIVVAIWTVVVKRGVEDILHTARGGTPHRYAAAKARRQSGAAGRYWSTLWSDTFDDMLQRHNEKRSRRDAAPAAGEKPRGPMRSVLADFGRDVSLWGRATWRHGWESAGRRQQARRLRPRPGQDTVPGTVVPNAQDEDRPQDGDGDGPDPQPVPAEDGTDLQDERPDPVQDEDGDGMADLDEDGIRICKRCRYQLTSVSPICENCLKSDPNSGPDSGPDQDISPTARPTTQEGPTMTTTMPTDTEVSSLNKAIHYSESTAHVAAEMINSIDFTESSLAAGGVTGIAVEAFASAKEKFGGIAADMERAAAEFKAQLAIQEAYNANPGAGSKEFVMGGR